VYPAIYYRNIHFTGLQCTLSVVTLNPKILISVPELIITFQKYLVLRGHGVENFHIWQIPVVKRSEMSKFTKFATTDTMWQLLETSLHSTVSSQLENFPSFQVLEIVQLYIYIYIYIYMADRPTLA